MVTTKKNSLSKKFPYSHVLKSMKEIDEVNSSGYQAPSLHQVADAEFLVEAPSRTEHILHTSHFITYASSNCI
jgi:hypothetical protein